VLGEPRFCLCFRDNREDFDRFGGDIIENPYFPDPQPILWLSQPPETLDPALAHPGWLVSQVPFDGIPDLGAVMGG